MTLHYHTYPNGLRIIYEKSKTNAPLTHIYLFCNVGSVHESDNLHGASHFIEHMCFKGTKNIPKAKDIFIEYDKIGAEFNAFTIKRATGYTVTCQNDYFHNCVNILGDMMFHSTFPKEEYKKEYDVVREENIADNNDFEDIINTNTDLLLYKGSSYANPIDSIKYHNKTPPDYNSIIDFYHYFYQPKNMILSVVSSLPFSKIKSLVSTTILSKYIRDIPIRPCGSPICHELSCQTDIQYHLQNRKGVENTLLTIGFRTCDMNSPDMYKLELLRTILIGGMSGRLFMLLREKHGLTYSIRVETENHEKHGGFVIFTQTDSAKLLKNGGDSNGVLPLIVKSLADLVKKGVSEEEFEIAKGNMKGDFIIQTTDDDERANYNGFEWLVREKKEDIVPYDDIYRTFIHPLKHGDIQDVIRKYFKRDKMTVCILSEKVHSLSKIKKCFDDSPL